MEFVIGAVVLVVIGYFLWTNNKSKPLDVNKDGKIDSKDITAATQVVAQEIKGVVAKVENEAKVVAIKAKVVATKAKTAVKKPTNAVKKVTTKKAKK